MMIRSKNYCNSPSMCVLLFVTILNFFLRYLPTIYGRLSSHCRYKLQSCTLGQTHMNVMFTVLNFGQTLKVMFTVLGPFGSSYKVKFGHLSSVILTILDACSPIQPSVHCFAVDHCAMDLFAAKMQKGLVIYELNVPRV